MTNKRNAPGTNVHHLLFEKSAWRSREETRLLRNKPSLQPRLDVEAHQALHREVGLVPLPGMYMARRILNDYVPGGNVYESIDYFCFAVEEARKHPKARYLEREVGSLIIASMRAQIPFIKWGLDERVS